MNKKFNEKTFIFYGINYIVGFGFIATISSVIKTGQWGILIFALTALIAGGVMLAFARGAQLYGTQIGGSYAYVKEAFPKARPVWFANGWNQFMQAPLFSATTPLFFSGIASLFIKSQQYQLLMQFGSLAFFVILTIISAMSLNVSKKVITATAIVKWIGIAIMFVGIIYLAIRNPHIQLLDKKNLTKVSPYILITSILNFIYSYGGVEGLAGLSSEVNTKNFRRILLSLFGIIIAIYTVFYIIFNFVPQIETNNSNFVAALLHRAFGISGLIVFAISLLFRQITSTVFSMVYYAKTVVPLAQDGFLPYSLAKRDKNGTHRNATIFVTIITVLAMIVFSIIPSLFNVSDRFGTILQAGNLVFFIQYLFAVIAILTISFKNKELKIPMWERIIYIIVATLIAFIALVTLFPPIVGENYDASSIIIISSYLGFVVLGFVVWGIFYAYDKKVSTKRYLTNLNSAKNSFTSNDSSYKLFENVIYTTDYVKLPQLSQNDNLYMLYLKDLENLSPEKAMKQLKTIQNFNFIESHKSVVVVQDFKQFKYKNEFKSFLDKQQTNNLQWVIVEK
ncbi:APC family permease [Mycoplasmopsis phocirhinis]|uniref:APC family permease n=1 Tax=Mycoplasmopsis phocirhinis TaxID=142650 RepID=A0A4P6MSU1_9BACT|nr:APC family permease [Mycoplasmopsis phocirhinis]QBF34951.1 APC family permease [Mycoplasmopsis phocirhinis]